MGGVASTVGNVVGGAANAVGSVVNPIASVAGQIPVVGPIAGPVAGYITGGPLGAASSIAGQALQGNYGGGGGGGGTAINPNNPSNQYSNNPYGPGGTAINPNLTGQQPPWLTNVQNFQAAHGYPVLGQKPTTPPVNTGIPTPNNPVLGGAGTTNPYERLHALGTPASLADYQAREAAERAARGQPAPRGLTPLNPNQPAPLTAPAGVLPSGPITGFPTPNNPILGTAVNTAANQGGYNPSGFSYMLAGSSPTSLGPPPPPPNAFPVSVGSVPTSGSLPTIGTPPLNTYLDSQVEAIRRLSSMNQPQVTPTTATTMPVGQPQVLPAARPPEAGERYDEMRRRTEQRGPAPRNIQPAGIAALNPRG